MGYMDQFKQVTKDDQAASAASPPSSDARKGFFDWAKHHSKDNPNEAIGILLPPYATYMDERIAAILGKKPFSTPFWVSRGLHAIGAQKDKNKFYCNCRKVLVEDNAADVGLVPKSIMDAGNSCPICDVCWGDVWPIVAKLKPSDPKDASPEYKHWKELHKWLCPQQKVVFNWLPMGSTEPVVFDAAQTLGKAIQQIHYDVKQPDLLWPVTNGGIWTSSWIQITRQKSDAATKYLANTVYVGQPHVIDQQGGFAEELYKSIIARVPDLRKLCDTFVPDAATVQKAIQKVNEAKRQFGLAVATDHATTAAVAQAITGVPGGVATSQPPITVLPVAPAMVPAPPAMGSPTFQPTPPAIPQAAITGDSTSAHAMLTSLMNNPPAGGPTPTAG